MKIPSVFNFRKKPQTIINYYTEQKYNQIQVYINVILAADLNSSFITDNLSAKISQLRDKALLVGLNILNPQYSCNHRISYLHQVKKIHWATTQISCPYDGERSKGKMIRIQPAIFSNRLIKYCIRYLLSLFINSY